MLKSLLVLISTLAAASAPPAAQDKPSGLLKGRDITLEGGTSFDLVSVDPDAGRLYVAHSPKIDVIDLKKGEKIGEVSGVEGAHAALAVPEFHRGFATSGQKNRLIVFDLETFKTTKEIETGQNPDGLLYVPSTKEVWSFNGRGKNVTCVDASTLDVKATVALEGQPEAAVDDPEKGVVYVNLEDKSSISVIDLRKHEVLATHSIAPGNAPTGIAFDPKNGLLFSGCANKKLVATSVATWKVVGSVDIGDRCDGVSFDPGTGNAFASCNDKTGGLHVKDATTFESLTPFETPGGKTCALDPKSHTLYVVSGPRRGEKGVVKVLTFSPK
jgi:DNA-binding beta-propeller fold protein YncE